MKEIGTTLFRNVFESGKAVERAWARLVPDLNDTRIEIVAEVQHATAIPWELMRDPETDKVLSVHARAFVRAPSNQAEPPTPRPSPAKGEREKIRILLVICRPRAGDDVPFRSVASRIVKSLSDEAREFVQLDVLRPPTIEQLSKVLHNAKARGEPYHVVHFDGHGVYKEVKQTQLSDLLKGLSPLVLGAPGKHGFLLFENPLDKENIQPIDGAAIGKLLTDNDVPALVLNACRSAFAEPPTQPLDASQAGDVGEQVRAFGSLAQAVTNAGVAGVVAMRYTLYVETAKEFIANLYAALAQGQSLGEAVTFGRKQLATNPLREIAFKPINLQDWCVPIVYESSAIELFPHVGAFNKTPLRIVMDTESQMRTTEIGLPPRPDVGFFGRDETLLALDRAFDSQQIVLLHAFAGSGKTTIAAEFARWYALTGGVAGAIFFTSFERRKTLVEALNETIGRAFNDALEHAGINWLALKDEQRRAVGLQALQQIPVLWIWDNVEPIAGFPARPALSGVEGTPSAWSAAEQQELVAFLRDARETKAKFLLTSRRDERGWLGDLPRRIIVPPMPMQERVQLARALAEKFGHRITEVEDWRPLLQFTQGNPLTITVLVGQALRDGLRTRDQIVAFVERLRKGETAFADEESEARSKSLGASLSYGFASAFTETERKQLALLHFFQGFVNVEALLLMDHPQNPARLPEVHGLTREDGIALLDRAAEIGLLTAHGNGYYSIHPALPWYFKSLFEQYYPTEDEGRRTNDESDHPSSSVVRPPSALRAFVEAMGNLGNYYGRQYASGNCDVVGALTAEEANLLHARQLARANGWWHAVINAMFALNELYNHTGRHAEWARLVNEIVPDFVDPATDGPLAGREEQWGFITDYRALLAKEARQWAEAERLQRVCMEWDRKNAASALVASPESLDGAGRNAIRTLAVSLGHLSDIQREQGKKECAKTSEEAIALYQRIGDRAAEATRALNLGRAYLTLPALRDLAQAERWCRRSLELRDERDRLGRSNCVNQLGLVFQECFKEARTAKKSEEEFLPYLNAAVQFYLQTLELTPPNLVDGLAMVHRNLGNIYSEIDDLDRALPHYREAIRYHEAGSNLYEAGCERFNVALVLAQAGRLADAREYAFAALRNFETFGDRAAEEIEKTKGLVVEIEEKMKKAESGKQ